MADLYLPHPCEQNWNGMKPENGGRFCQSCKKLVIDFSSMSVNDIHAYLDQHPEGSVCGRFLKEQLAGQNSSQDMVHASNARFSVGKRKIKWLMAVGLLLGLGARSFAQGAPLRKKLPDQILCTSADTKVKQNGLLKQKMLTSRKSFRMKLLARKTRPVRVSTN